MSFLRRAAGRLQSSLHLGGSGGSQGAGDMPRARLDFGGLAIRLVDASAAPLSTVCKLCFPLMVIVVFGRVDVDGGARACSL